jgi:glycosyltransferase involved in cell wall biosynthesis
MDDGSTDGSTAIAREYAARNPDRIHYLDQEGHANCGASARNLGIRNANSVYVSSWMPMTSGYHANWNSRWPSCNRSRRLACSADRRSGGIAGQEILKISNAITSEHFVFSLILWSCCQSCSHYFYKTRTSRVLARPDQRENCNCGFG